MIVVYTSVVCDLLHIGHINLFKKAKELGDKLIVGVISDEGVSRYKRTPIIPLEQRIAIISALKYVDIVIEQDERSGVENMKKLDKKFGDSNDFGIVSITIDPSHDRPSILKKYSEDLGVKSQNWHFLTGDRNYIYDLANKGFNIYANENPNFGGGFEHQGYFALIDKQGYIRSRNDDYGNPILYYLGINDQSIDLQGIDMLENDITKLIDE